MCGLVLTGERIPRLRAIIRRLDAIGREQLALQQEAIALRHEHVDLLRAVEAEGSGRRVRPGPATPARSRPPESRPEVVRDVLLWLGSTLLAVAALIFALFAWKRLDDGGRAVLLVAMTFLAGLAAGATLKRLPATAEALGGLTLALFLVDWFALRRGGVGTGMPATVWWAIGTAMAAGLATAAAPRLRMQAVAAANLIQVSAVLTVLHMTDEGWSRAVALALVAAPLAGAAGRLSRSRVWLGAAVVLGCGAALMEAAALAMVDDAFVLGDGTVSAQLALVLAAAALAPAAAVLTVGAGSRARRDALVAAGAGCLLGAVTMLLSAAWTQPTSLLAALAVLGAAGVGLALLLPDAVRPGSLYAALGALGVGVLRLLEPVAEAVAIPLSWLEDPWEAVLSGDAGTRLGQGRTPRDLAFGASVVALLALAAAAAALVASARGRRLVPLAAPLAAGTAAAVGVVVTAPLAADWPVWGAMAATAAGAITAMAGAAAADRRGLRLPSLVLGAAAAVLGAVAGPWPPRPGRSPSRQASSSPPRPPPAGPAPPPSARPSPPRRPPAWPAAVPRWR